MAATLDRVPRNDVNRLESFLKAAGRVLHPQHSVLLEVKRMLFSLYGSAPGFSQTELSEEQMARKLALGEEYVAAVSRVDPGLTKWRGQILYESNKIKLVRGLQALQTRKIGVEAFLKELTKSATELEEAVAGRNLPGSVALASGAFPILSAVVHGPVCAFPDSRDPAFVRGSEAFVGRVEVCLCSPSRWSFPGLVVSSRF